MFKNPVRKKIYIFYEKKEYWHVHSKKCKKNHTNFYNKKTVVLS